MSGLFAAAFLRQIGWRVDVYERSAVELVGRGAGITTHPELIDALTKSGAGTESRHRGGERIALDRQGRITGERPLRQILTSWDRLQRLLRDDYRPRALSPRPLLRARRPGRPWRPRSHSPEAALSTPISSLA